EQPDKANEAEGTAFTDATASRDLDASIAEFLQREMSTTIDDFLAKALATYEAIVAAFNSGDRETLRNLVSTDVYDAFAEVIRAREAARMRVETMFARIDPPKIVDGVVDATHVEVSVRFVG